MTTENNLNTFSDFILFYLLINTSIDLEKASDTTHGKKFQYRAFRLGI